MKIKFSIILLLSMATCGVTKAQDWAVKTNLLSDAFLNPNAAIEVGLAPRWSLDIGGQLNLWNLSGGERHKHWLLQPEVRYWLCDRFSGHFFGAHLLGGQYNFGAWRHGSKFLGTDFSRLKDSRHQGWYAGAGIAYGYTWILSRHWSAEAEIGIGWAYTRYDVYPCAECGNKLAERQVHNYFGPTKAAINLIYVF